MTTRKDTGTTANFLPALAALILLCLGGAAALTLLTHSNTPPAAPAELSLVVQRMPFEAQNALRGEASAFDALAKSAVRLKALRGALPEPGAGGAAGATEWTKLTAGVSTVGEARTAVETIQVANQEARELAPKLLSELGDLASAVGVAEARRNEPLLWSASSSWCSAFNKI